MAERRPITGAKTMWELIERRAELDPDRPMLIDEADRTLTFGEFRDRAERVAAGLAQLGIGEDTPVSWQLPTRIDTIVLSAALCRLGAVQNPIIHLYREPRGGLRAPPDRRAVLRRSRRVFRGLRLPSTSRRGSPPGSTTPPAVIVVDDGLPEGDPSTLPPPPPDARRRRDAGPLDLLHVREHRPTRRACATPTSSLLAGGWGLAVALDMSPDDVGSIAFPYAHIGGPDYLVTMLSLGFPAVLIEAFSAAEVLPVLRKHGVTMVGGSTAFYIAFLAEQRKQPDDPILPTLRLMSGGGAPKPPELHYEVQREIGGRGTSRTATA